MEVHETPKTSICFLNLMNSNTGAFDSAQTPPDSIADLDQVLGGEGHTYYVLAGVRDESTAADIVACLAERGLACTSSHSSLYGHGVYRSLCVALSSPQAPYLTWDGRSAEIEGEWPVVKQTFVAADVEVCLAHMLRASGGPPWPALKPVAPAAPKAEEVKTGQKTDGTAYFECVTCDYVYV